MKTRPRMVWLLRSDFDPQLNPYRHGQVKPFCSRNGAHPTYLEVRLPSDIRRSQMRTPSYLRAAGDLVPCFARLRCLLLAPLMKVHATLESTPATMRN